MASTLKDLIENLKAIEQDLPEVIRQSAEIMAHDGKALAERLIKDKGFGALYSNQTIPAWYLVGKEINMKGVKYVDDAYDNDEGVNWKGMRKAQGLQINFVDLSYTARMWNGMRPEPVKVEGGKYYCIMGHNDNEGKKKMNYNFERYGDFIGIALKGQEDVLKEVAVENIFNLFDKYLK